MRPGWLIRVRSEDHTTHRRRQRIRLEIPGEQTLCCGGADLRDRSLAPARQHSPPCHGRWFFPFSFPGSGCKEGEKLMRKIEISGCAAQFAPETANCGQEKPERKARQFFPPQLPLSWPSSSTCLGEQIKPVGVAELHATQSPSSSATEGRGGGRTGVRAEAMPALLQVGEAAGVGRMRREPQGLRFGALAFVPMTCGWWVLARGEERRPWLAGFWTGSLVNSTLRSALEQPTTRCVSQSESRLLDWRATLLVLVSCETCGADGVDWCGAVFAEPLRLRSPRRGSGTGQVSTKG